MTKLPTIYVSPAGFPAKPSACVEQIAREIAERQDPNSAEALDNARLIAEGIRRFAFQAEYWVRDRMTYERARLPGADYSRHKAAGFDQLQADMMEAAILPRASTPADDALFEQLQTEAHRWTAGPPDAEQDDAAARVA